MSPILVAESHLHEKLGFATFTRGDNDSKQGSRRVADHRRTTSGRDRGNHLCGHGSRPVGQGKAAAGLCRALQPAWRIHPRSESRAERLRRSQFTSGPRSPTSPMFPPTP